MGELTQDSLASVADSPAPGVHSAPPAAAPLYPVLPLPTPSSVHLPLPLPPRGSSKPTGLLGLTRTRFLAVCTPLLPSAAGEGGVYHDQALC